MIYEQHQGFSIETNKRSKHYSMSEPHYHDGRIKTGWGI